MNLKKVSDSKRVQDSLALQVIEKLDAQPEAGSVEVGDVEGLNINFSHNMDDVDMEDVYRCTDAEDNEIDTFVIEYDEDWNPVKGENIFVERDKWIEKCLKDHN